MAPPQNAKPLTTTTRSDVYPAVSALHALRNTAEGISVLITGAGRGVGRAQAIAFAQAGAQKIIIISRSAHELAEVEGAIKGATSGRTEVLKVRADVTSEEDVRKAFDLAGDVHGTASSCPVSRLRG